MFATVSISSVLEVGQHPNSIFSFSYWFCQLFVIMQSFHFISVISFWILKYVFHTRSNSAIFLLQLIFTRQFRLRLQTAFISDFTSDSLVAAAWMALQTRTMELHMDAVGKNNLENECWRTLSTNFVSTINTVLVYRYTEGSIFVHQSVIQWGKYNI